MMMASAYPCIAGRSFRVPEPCGFGFGRRVQAARSPRPARRSSVQAIAKRGAAPGLRGLLPWTAEGERECR